MRPMSDVRDLSRDGGAAAGAGRTAWVLFAVLFVLMVQNFVDRQIVVSMFPHLEGEFALSDRELGGLVSIVAVAIAIFTVPIAVVADRYGRLHVIISMALVWSAATVACAFAGTATQLAATRAVVGIGEAAFGAVGAAILASVFPERFRSTVLAGFLSAALVGSVLGVALGGILAERWGWRIAFAAVGVPGIVIALALIATTRDGLGIRRVTTTEVTFREIVAGLRRPRSLAIACVASGLQLVTVSAVYAWLPSHFHRAWGMAPAQAGTRAALVVLAAGVGALLWGALADRLDRRVTGARLKVPAVLALATAVVLSSAFAATSPGSLQFALILAGATLMTCNIGTASAAVIDVVPASLRASAASVLALVHNLVGLAVGPLAAGWISDRHGLGAALAIVPIASLFAAVGFAVAARTYPGDRVRAGAPTVAVRG
ncbi:MAG: hypothetical protein AMXMBFR42_09500 [Burkholderiales bacterium]